MDSGKLIPTLSLATTTLTCEDVTANDLRKALTESGSEGGPISQGVRSELSEPHIASQPTTESFHQKLRHGVESVTKPLKNFTSNLKQKLPFKRFSRSAKKKLSTPSGTHTCPASRGNANTTPNDVSNCRSSQDEQHHDLDQPDQTASIPRCLTLPDFDWRTENWSEDINNHFSRIINCDACTDKKTECDDSGYEQPYDTRRLDEEPNVIPTTDSHRMPKFSDMSHSLSFETDKGLDAASMLGSAEGDPSVVMEASCIPRGFCLDETDDEPNRASSIMSDEECEHLEAMYLTIKKQKPGTVRMPATGQASETDAASRSYIQPESCQVNPQNGTEQTRSAEEGCLTKAGERILIPVDLSLSPSASRASSSSSPRDSESTMVADADGDTSTPLSEEEPGDAGSDSDSDSLSANAVSDRHHGGQYEMTVLDTPRDTLGMSWGNKSNVKAMVEISLSDWPKPLESIAEEGDSSDANSSDDRSAFESERGLRRVKAKDHMRL